MSVSIPRASGGVSHSGLNEFVSILYSPRKRGCFYNRRPQSCARTVFPAQAGVFPKTGTARPLGLSIPRASGGVSSALRRSMNFFRYSPRKRGCFWRFRYGCFLQAVFPAQAGVFLCSIGSICSSAGIPRASGGVSAKSKLTPLRSRYSPRKRGCFCASESEGAGSQYSPRKRGCFQEFFIVKKVRYVFPAQAGVFPGAFYQGDGKGCIPRASGGVSTA